MDASVYDGKKPYLVKINKYGTNGYEKYPNNLYNGLEIEMNTYILVSSKNIKIINLKNYYSCTQNNIPVASPWHIGHLTANLFSNFHNPLPYSNLMIIE